MIVACTKILKEIMVKEFETFTDREVSVISIEICKP